MAPDQFDLDVIANLAQRHGITLLEAEEELRAAFEHAEPTEEEE